MGVGRGDAFIPFLNGSMSAEVAQEGAEYHLPVLIFCNINDKGDDKEPIDY